MPSRVAVVLLACSCAPPTVVAGAGSSSSGAESSGSDTEPIAVEGSSSSGPTPTDTGIDPAPDLGGPPPEPGAMARLVVDVATEGGHALDLHTWDGLDAPVVRRLLPESPDTAMFTVTPLGVGERLAVAVRYGSGHQEAFLVDWSGDSVVVESLADATSILRVYHVESLDAVVVRTDNTFTRFDLGGEAPGVPIPLLEDLPFGMVFEDDDPVMPHVPVLALREASIFEDLYIGDIADPSAPTVRATDFVDTPWYPGRPVQLAGGHLVFPAYSHVGDPTGVRVVPRIHGAWGGLLDLRSPADPTAPLGSPTPIPGDAGFVYSAARPDLPEGADLRLGRIDEGWLAAPIVLDVGGTSQHTFTTDGARLVYVRGDPGAVEVIAFDGVDPSAPQRVVDAVDVGGARVVLSAIGDGGTGFARLRLEDAYSTHAVVRFALDEPRVEVIAGDLGGAAEIVELSIAPDGRSAAFTASSPTGFVTSVVDCAGDRAGPAILAAEPDGPIVHALRPSPDSGWLAIEGSTGGQNPTDVVVVDRDAPQSAVLTLAGLRGPTVWLP